MTVSKRTRYEVLRRDNHTCRYCGGTAPDAILTVDHVVPVSLGGSDAPDNLVAACQDCNYGKASSNPDAPLVENVGDDALRWAKAMQEAAAIARSERDDEMSYFDAFLLKWPQYRHLPHGAEGSIGAIYRAGLPEDSMLDALDIALYTRGVDARFNYFCGVCWRRIRKLQEIAQGLIETEKEL